MAELKTQKTKASVSKFVESVKHEQRRKDSKELLKIFAEATGKKPVMWGTSIIGYGEYHYKYASGQEGDWPVTGFSPRKQNLSIYIMPGFIKYGDLLNKLGKYKTSVACLYVNKLEDIDVKVLKQLIKKCVADMKKIYQCK